MKLWHVINNTPTSPCTTKKLKSALSRKCFFILYFPLFWLFCHSISSAFPDVMWPQTSQFGNQERFTDVTSHYIWVLKASHFKQVALAAIWGVRKKKCEKITYCCFCFQNVSGKKKEKKEVVFGCDWYSIKTDQCPVPAETSPFLLWLYFCYLYYLSLFIISWRGSQSMRHITHCQITGFVISVAPWQ